LLIQNSNILLELERDTSTSLYFIDLVQLQHGPANPFMTQPHSKESSSLIAASARIRKTATTQTLSIPKRFTRKQLAVFIEKVMHLHKSLGHSNFRVLATAVRDGIIINCDLDYNRIMLASQYVDCVACALGK